MKLHLKIDSGEATPSEHLIELDLPRSDDVAIGQCTVDGQSLEIDGVQVAPGVYSILWQGRSFEVRLARPGAGEKPGRWVVIVGSRQYLVEVQDPRRSRRSAGAGRPSEPQDVLAPMPGRIVKILAAEGQSVAQGQALLVMEAMKMQNEIRAPRSGNVQKIYTAEGASVESGAALVRLA